MSTNNYLSTLKPKFKPTVHSLGKIPAYQYKGSLKEELAAGTLTPAQTVDVLEDMLMIREFEEMIVKLRSGAYDACKGYQYRGPTHVSIGQSHIRRLLRGDAPDDQITSTLRHGDSLPKLRRHPRHERGRVEGPYSD